MLQGRQVFGMGGRAAESPGDWTEVRSVDVDTHGFDAFVRKELPNLAVAFVVPDQEDDVQLGFDRAGNLSDRELGGAVANEADDR